MKTKKNKFFLWALWILSIGIPFTIIVFPFFQNKIGSISAWSDVWPIISPMILPAFMIGITTALLQYLLLKSTFFIGPQWFMLTMVGFSFGPIFSAVLTITILGIAYPKIMNSGGEHFLFFPGALSMILSGLVIGILQNNGIRYFFEEKPKISARLLWIFLSTLAWSLSFVTGSLMVVGQPRLQSMLAGITIGLISGIFFIIIDKEKNYSIDQGLQ
jgi:hypothetical protein